MNSQNGTVGSATGLTAQSKIEGKLSVSWELLYSLESRIGALGARLMPVSTPPTPSDENEQKLVSANDSPIAHSIMSQSIFMEKLASKLDEISARLEC